MNYLVSTCICTHAHFVRNNLYLHTDVRDFVQTRREFQFAHLADGSARPSVAGGGGRRARPSARPGPGPLEAGRRQVRRQGRGDVRGGGGRVARQAPGPAQRPQQAARPPGARLARASAAPARAAPPRRAALAAAPLDRVRARSARPRPPGPPPPPVLLRRPQWTHCGLRQH